MPNVLMQSPSKRLDLIEALAGVPRFKDRGDPSAWDFYQTSYAADGAYHDWDLGSIVPAGAKAVLVAYGISHTAAGYAMYVRKKGNSNLFNSIHYSVLIPNINFYGEGICPIGADLKLEYRFSPATWTNVNLLIKGWFI